MAALRLAFFKLLCLLLFNGRAVNGSVKAYVRWTSHLSNSDNIKITSVIISNRYLNVSINENFTEVKLPDSVNGPDSYWSVSVTCVGGSVMLNDTYLFLNSTTSSHPRYHTLCIYGDCTADTPPNLFIQSLDKASPKTPDLGIDRALLQIANNLSHPVNVSQLSDNCYKCRPYSLGLVMPGQWWYTVLDTSFGWTINIYLNSNDSTLLNTTDEITMLNENETLLCHDHRRYMEHSKYSFTLMGGTMSDGNITCSMDHLNKMSEYAVYLPILYAVVAILGVALLWGLYKVVWWSMNDRGCLHYLHLTRVDRVTARDLGNPNKVASRYGAVSPQETEPLNQQSNSSLNNGVLAGTPPEQATNSTAPETQKPPPKKRLASLDTFRGFSLMIMIFVNYGGGGYWFFNHSRWNGLTVADLVFPWFVWIMGVAIVFSYKGRRKDSLFSRLYQIIRRTVILFGLGLFLNNGFYVQHWRIPGVLQRFSISYFVVALTELFTVELSRVTKWPTPKRKFLLPFRDITSNAIQWILIIILEILWLCLTFLLPVDGCPRGYLGPGGLSLPNPNQSNCTGGAAGAIDKWLFGYNHLYQHPTAKELYMLKTPYDPEGALGSLNSIVICFLGVQAGRILISYKKSYNILLRFLFWGVLLGGLGLILCEGRKNGGLIPLNKNLWSLSFILVMAGTAFILLAVFYLVIDVISWWSGAPFKYPGMNSILVYVGSEILQGYFPFSWKQQSDSHTKLLFANLAAVTLWIVIAYYWFTIGFFIKI